MRKLAVVVIVLLLDGCSNTGVIPMDRDSFMIAKTGGGMPGLGVSYTNKAEIYGQANDFCGAKGLDVETLRLTDIPAAPARLRSIELQFRCVPKGGTAMPLVRESDKIIELRNR